LWINWLSYIPSIKGVNWPVQYINSPNTIPPMSIGLHVWIVHQPKRCVHFIAVHRPLRLAHTSAHAVKSVLLYYISPYILIAICYYIGPYSPSYGGPYVLIAIFVQLAEIRWLRCYRHLYMSGLTVLLVGYD